MAAQLVLLPLLTIIILNLPFKSLLKKIAFYAASLLMLGQIYLAIFGAECWTRKCVITENLFSLNFSVDNLTQVMLLLIGIVALATLLVGNSLIKALDKKFNFINLLIISVIGMNGVVLVDDLFSMYIFLEITAIASFVLIAMNKGKDSLEGSFKYIVMSSIATIMMLSAIAILLLTSGSTSFAVTAVAVKNPKQQCFYTNCRSNVFGWTFH
ncbi:proton-conducting transporter membrane subunit [Elusimicrobiota bacterium]